MPIVNIESVKVISPYTIEIKGYLGQNPLQAIMAGANLEIRSTHPMTKEEHRQLEEEFQDLFSTGPFKQSELKKILKNHSKQIKF
jgi:Ca2+-binding EF-hand superfamily protein